MSASFLARSFPLFPTFSSNSRYTTELLEIHSEDPSSHILVLPGNPGVVGFCQDFVEAIYEVLRGKASVTAIGHLSHTRKVDFIRKNLQKKETPFILVGHSIGAYGALEAYKIFQNEVTCAVGVYPFLALNRKSLVQIFLVYNTTRNTLNMAMTEFKKLAEEPDWTFIKENQNQLAFLFGTDDYWGPLSILEEMCERAPETTLTVESEGHTHAFCCSEAGSKWAAHYLARLIEEKVQLQL